MFAVIMLAVLNRDDTVVVFFWQDLTVMDWLNGRVIVILVNFTVDGGGHFFVLLLLNVLVDHSWCNFLVNSGIMLARLGTRITS